MAGVAYLMMLFLPRNQSEKAVTIWVFGYLITQYLDICLNKDPQKYSVVNTTMHICAKMHGLACVLSDGAKPEKELTPG